MPNGHWQNWTWNDERVFIDGLGTWSLSDAPRCFLLRQYLKALNSGNTSPPWYFKAEEYVRKALALECK